MGWAHLEYFIPCGDNPNLKDTSEKFLADVEIIEIDKNPKVQMRFYFEYVSKSIDQCLHVAQYPNWDDIISHIKPILSQYL